VLIEINLAPDQGTKRRSSGASRLALPKLPALAADSRTAFGGAAALLLVILVGFGIWRVGDRRSTLEAELATEIADSTRFATTIELVSSLRARQDTITQKINVIRDVDQRRYVWPHLLDEISGAIPAFTWLTEISSTEGADSLQVGPVFTLQGNAGSTQALTRFMKNLEESPFIRDVTLVTTEQTPIEGRQLHRFTLEAKYETPDPVFLETVPVVMVE
jgi:Tfp pilus assembly protein PilN